MIGASQSVALLDRDGNLLLHDPVGFCSSKCIKNSAYYKHIPTSWFINRYTRVSNGCVYIVRLEIYNNNHITDFMHDVDRGAATSRGKTYVYVSFNYLNPRSFIRLSIEYEL